MLKETHRASFEEVLEIDVDCYVLDNKVRVISQRGMGIALGQTGSGGRFIRIVSGKILANFIGPALAKKIASPIDFTRKIGGPAKGYNATILIDVCKAIIKAKNANKLQPNQENLYIQAQIIVNSTAKYGIINLIDQFTGYDTSRQEYIELYKNYILEEAREYRKEFPDDFYNGFYKIYKLDPTQYKNHPQFFAGITRKYVYHPLAKSNGAILNHLDKKNPIFVKIDGRYKREYKLFQFLEETGLNALRVQIAQITILTRIAKDKTEFTKLFGMKYFRG